MRKLLTTLITTAAMALLLTVTVCAAPTDDITAPYDAPTEAQLTAALRYDIADYAGLYLEAAERYGINVYFLVAKDALESGWGRYESAQNNLGGWISDDGGYMAFDSIEDYIDHTARNLRDMYLTDGGIYHTGYTLEDVNRYYNGSQEWLDEVAGIWAMIEGRVNDANG